MALKAIIDSLDGLDEGLKSHYRAGTADEGTEGKFVLAVDGVGGFALENVTGLKSALGAERTARERAEGQIAKFKDLDPDKARRALEEVEQLKAIDPAKEADKLANTKFEAAKAQLIEAHSAELQGREQRIGLLTKTVEELLIDAAATAALAEAKGSVELLLPHVRKHTKVKEVDGRFTVEVIDGAGNARIAGSKGEPMDIKGLVAEMRQSDTFARAFDGEGHSGSGKVEDAGAGGRPKNFNPADLVDPAKRTAAIAARFPDLARAS